MRGNRRGMFFSIETGWFASSKLHEWEDTDDAYRPVRTKHSSWPKTTTALRSTLHYNCTTLLLQETSHSAHCLIWVSSTSLTRAVFFRVLSHTLFDNFAELDDKRTDFSRAWANMRLRCPPIFRTNVLSAWDDENRNESKWKMFSQHYRPDGNRNGRYDFSFTPLPRRILIHNWGR